MHVDFTWFDVESAPVRVCLCDVCAQPAASHASHHRIVVSEKFEMNAKVAARIIDGLIRTRICFYFSLSMTRNDDE